MSYDEQHRRPGDLDGAPGAYEHPALDDGPGYWAERWTEFKRLFAQNWHENGTKERVYLCVAVIVVVFVWEFLVRVAMSVA